MALTKAQLVDMNANELILDLDADTSITSDTDDTIDIKIGGADDFQFTANTFTALAGSTITGPTIVGTTSVQTPLIEFTDGDDAMTIADGGVVTFAQSPVFPDGSLALVDLDIDGATDIGAAVVDADLFIIDDGANGTNRKVTAARVKTYMGAEGGAFSLANLDIDGATDIGAGIVDADLFIIDDGAGGTNRKVAASRIKTYIGSSTAADDLTIGDAAILLTTSSGNITVDAAANDSDIIFKGTDGGSDTTFLTIDGSAAGDATFNNQVIVGDGKLVLGSTAVTSTAAELNLLDNVSGLVQADLTKLAAVDSTAAELNILDDATVTTAELNLIDGGTARGTTAVADADGLLTNDGGTMRMTSAATFKTYFQEGISQAYDDFTVGDAAVTVSTSSGNITVDSIAGAVSIDGHTGVTLASSNSGDITLDSVADINLDAGGADIVFKDGGTQFGKITNASTHITIFDGTTLNTTMAGANITFAGTVDSGAITSTGIVTGTGFTAGSATLAESELELLDGLTAGTAIASKVVTTDANIDNSGMRNLTISGELDAATLDISGAIDVAGTAVLDGGVEIDNFTINGAEIDLSSGDLLVDVAGDITLDAGGGDFLFNVATTNILKITNSSSDVIIKPVVDAKDIIFQQRDGTSILEINDGAFAKFTAAAIAPEAALTDASTVTINALTQSVSKIVLGGNRTIGLASGGVAGAFISILVIQDGTGSRTVTWNAAYEFTGNEAPTLTTTANLGDLFVFRYNGAKWLETGRNLALVLS